MFWASRDGLTLRKPSQLLTRLAHQGDTGNSSARAQVTAKTACSQRLFQRRQRSEQFKLPQIEVQEMGISEFCRILEPIMEVREAILGNFGIHGIFCVEYT